MLCQPTAPNMGFGLATCNPNPGREWRSVTECSPFLACQGQQPLDRPGLEMDFSGLTEQVIRKNFPENFNYNSLEYH